MINQVSGTVYLCILGTIQPCAPQINSMNRREVKTSQYTNFHHVALAAVPQRSHRAMSSSDYLVDTGATPHYRLSRNSR